MGIGLLVMAHVGLVQTAAAQPGFGQPTATQAPTAQPGPAPSGLAAVSAQLDTSAYLVGQPIRLTLEADGSNGTTVVWPDFSQAPVEGLELFAEDSVDASGENRLRKEYVFQQFDTGRFTLPPLPLYMVRGNGATADTLTLATPALRFRVLDVPVDTAEGLRPITGIQEVSFRRTPWFLIGLVALVLVGLGIYALYRRLSKDTAVEEAPSGRIKPLKPIADYAMDRLAELQAKRLWQNDRIDAYYVELTDIVREYAELRFGLPVLESPTAEIMPRLVQHPEVSSAQAQQLRGILELGDAVKFARFQPLPDQHKKAFTDAEGFIQQTRPVERDAEGDVVDDARRAKDVQPKTESSTQAQQP